MGQIVLNLRHLDGLVAATRHRSITAAAAAVNLAQPTLTQALGKIERQLGQRLFDRQPDGVQPTEAGRLLAARAARALERIADGCRAVRRAARLPQIAFPERHVSITQLRSFLEVERSGSFVAAAEALGVSQPSAHRAARQLELVVGVPLLVRDGRALRATLAGERLARGARLAMAELRAGLDEVAALRSGGGARVVIGTLPLPKAGLLPQALARFAEARPQADVSVVDGSYPELLAGLQNGDLDLLLGALRTSAPPDGVRQEALFEEELFIVGAAGHPLADGRHGADALARYPWAVAAPGAPTRATWDALFADGEGPSRRVQCGSTQTTRGLLLAGHWLALMSPDQFRLEEAAGLLRAIGGAVPGSRQRIGITTRADWQPTPAQRAMVETLRHLGTPHRVVGSEKCPLTRKLALSGQNIS